MWLQGRRLEDFQREVRSKVSELKDVVDRFDNATRK